MDAMPSWFSWWALWFLVALLAAVIEIVSPTFGFVFVSGAALLSFLVAGLGVPWPWQVVVFAVAILAGLLLVRPYLTRRFGPGKPIPSRAERLVGLQGVVTEEIDSLRGRGRILVQGEDWAARSTEMVSVGAQVFVEQADGIVLLVSPVVE